MGWSGALHDPSVCRWCPQATTVGDVRPMAMSFITLVLPASTTSRYPAGRRGEFSSDQLLPKYTGLPRLTSPNGGWRRSQRWQSLPQPQPGLRSTAPVQHSNFCILHSRPSPPPRTNRPCSRAIHRSHSWAAPQIQPDASDAPSSAPCAVPSGLVPHCHPTWDCATLRPRLGCGGPSGFRSAKGAGQCSLGRNTAES